MHHTEVDIVLVRADDNMWRVLIDDVPQGQVFQYPWHAMQCAINGSLTGKPAQGLRTIAIKGSTHVDETRLEEIREAERKQRALLESLRGVDGEGI